MFNPETLQEAISQAILNYKLPERPARLYEPIIYTLQSGGKRLRPMLTLATCAAFGGDWEKAMPAALALEMFHNFTLLHDDVMDNADVRRGRPTVHRKWDTNTAILSGDAMLTLAYTLLCKTPENVYYRLFDVFNRSTMEVYEGQQYDMDFEDRNDVTISEYLEMIRLKTSVLPGCACAMGAIIAGAPQGVVDKLYEYGVNLGLAFQLQDDWLDTFGDPLVFGKEIGGDIKCRKKTWLLITALNEDNDNRLKEILNDRSLTDHELVEKVTEIYNSIDLSRRCSEKVAEYSERALRNLDEIDYVNADGTHLPDHADMQYFKSLVERLGQRKY